ncbi:MAG: ATP-binding cassette domain-containing protein [Clostridiales bacterium]|nr:ATP-binding cassette domain-containing protein [Clostridiales bacterium]
MPLLSVDNISKSYGERCLLDGVSFRINEGDKIAFIGCNGAGKSTLFKIIKGVEHADSGRVILHGNTIVGFLSQNMDEQDLSENTLKPRVLIEAEERKIELESDISLAGDDEELLKDLMKEYAEVTARYEALGGYDYDHRIVDALSGLGLTGIDGRTDLSTLSGGEKMRVCLARLIVERPDILLLDEPTNHLDIDAVEWLEGFLQSYGGAVFVISHDRYFIDRISNRVIELQDSKIREYKGNYEAYKIQKAEFLKTQEAVVANLEKELEHQLDVKQTMLSHRNISGYHQREKMVDKLMAVLEKEKAMLPSMSNSMSFTPMPAERSGAEDKILLQVKDISKNFDDGPFVFEHISFELKANMKIFLCGPNGCGKTTLLTMLLGKQGGFDGTVYISAAATMGYMAQFVPFDDEDLTCFDELIARSDLTNTQARSMLARFGFRGEDVFKKISVLSGGERSRLYLCCLLQENPDILFLDEPTNHLDIESREILEDALKEYNGAIVCVSHDRFFIDKCADKILGFMNGTAELFDRYEYYRKAVSRRITETETATVKSEEQKVSRETDGKIRSRNKASERKEAARKRERMVFLEKEIERVEAEQRELEESFTNGAGAAEYEKYAENSRLIEAMYEEYMELSE